MPIEAESPRAWRAVLEHVERRLLDGDLLPGERLPGERALAADLGVGRSSVREALRVLEAMGLVRTASGSGPNAGAIIVATPGGAMSALMRLQVAAHGFPVADIVRTRLILESAVAGELAERAGAEAGLETLRSSTGEGAGLETLRSSTGEGAGLETLRSSTGGSSTGGSSTGGSSTGEAGGLPAAERLLDAMDSPDLEPAEFLALDAAFHLALAEASGNQVVTATMAGLRSSIEGYALDGLARIDDWHATSARLRREHRGVVDAIRAADAPTARRRIHDHISGYYAETFPEPAPTPAAAPAHA
ncbi:DNA-binding FadR family transcriptional regulator [Agromyces terreus]|uniref:DNA-binding FadR family transcriptional regulator n=1 Tax=Agromyces terreus TaxID=424795 RepID=A0A9X2GWU7_9MICO|nr:FCD domain-containing protein [Agromyces terreus]MCP2370132.1 DNA-binding FadR family transcriptional regulator [Agromyces terreus]